MILRLIAVTAPTLALIACGAPADEAPDRPQTEAMSPPKDAFGRTPKEAELAAREMKLRLAEQRLVRENEERARRDAQLAEQRRMEAEAFARAQAVLASMPKDKEPTEYEMNQAMRNTAAGRILGANLKKLGKCRRAGEWDYYCRYRIIGVNWGNFWKENGVWYFKIAN